MLIKDGFSFTALAISSSLFFLITGCNTKQEKKQPAIEQEIVVNEPVLTRDSLRFKKPTIRWASMMSEGSDFYTPEDIRLSDQLLDQYLGDLAAAKDTVAIWKAVEKVVTGFDKLSLRSDFIETGEREELAEFIQVAAEVYGLTYDGDITERWRNEW